MWKRWQEDEDHRPQHRKHDHQFGPRERRASLGPLVLRTTISFA
jgi:hypothetical protein